MPTALEAEVTEFLGRERYARGDRDRAGSRNGYCPTTVKTTAGPVTLDRPKMRGTDEQFASRLLGVGVCRTNALESLVIAGFIRGLSVRDVEACLADALGSQAALSKVKPIPIVAGALGARDRDPWYDCPEEHP
jgi:putative transposase